MYNWQPFALETQSIDVHALECVLGLDLRCQIQVLVFQQCTHPHTHTHTHTHTYTYTHTHTHTVSRSTHASKETYQALSYALSVCKDPTVLNSMRFVFLYEHTGQARFNTVERKIKQCINYQIIYKRQSICQSYTQSSNQSYNQSFDYNKTFHYHCWGSFQVENH